VDYVAVGLSTPPPHPPQNETSTLPKLCPVCERLSIGIQPPSEEQLAKEAAGIEVLRPLLIPFSHGEATVEGSIPGRTASPEL